MWWFWQRPIFIGVSVNFTMAYDRPTGSFDRRDLDEMLEDTLEMLGSESEPTFEMTRNDMVYAWEKKRKELEEMGYTEPEPVAMKYAPFFDYFPRGSGMGFAALSIAIVVFGILFIVM